MMQAFISSTTVTECKAVESWASEINSITPDSTNVRNIAKIVCDKTVDLYSFVVRYRYTGVILIEIHIKYAGRRRVLQRHLAYINQKPLISIYRSGVA